MKDKLEILLSCMYQTDDIIKRSNIKCNATVVNQCDKDEKRIISNEGIGGTCKINWIDSTKRGLSRSRNMALYSASCDYCLISDDDEVFVDGVDKIIEKAFKDNPKSDVLIFKLNNWETKCPSHTKNVGYIQAMRTASCQIAFRRTKIKEKNIFFDEEMGSGTGHGAGEECKFLFTCLRKGLRLTFVPETIATLQVGSDSQWFSGYDCKYFFWHGWATKRILGTPLAMVYALYTAVTKYRVYSENLSAMSATRQMLKGIFYKNKKQIVFTKSLF